jgi:hypothetical protein
MLGVLGVQALKPQEGMIPFWLLGALWLLVPLLSTQANDPLMSLSRYTLVNVPLFIAFGFLPRHLSVWISALLALGLVLGTALFARCWWVA